MDQKINVVVLDFDDDKKRISLGLKQLTPHPWDILPEWIHEGANVKGKVVMVMVNDPGFWVSDTSLFKGKEMTIQFFDLTGKKIASIKTPNHSSRITLNTNSLNLTNGLYFIRAFSDNNQFTGKLIVKK